MYYVTGSRVQYARFSHLPSLSGLRPMRRGIRSPLYAFSLEIDIVGFWVGKCIGGGNMKYFANFTLSVVVSFLYIIVSRIPIVFRFINSLCSVSSSPL